MASIPWSKTDTSSFIPQYWATKAVLLLENYLALSKLASRDWQDEFKSPGDTINVRKRLAFSAVDKAAATDLEYQNPTASTVAVVLNKYKVVPIAAEDVVLTETQPEVMTQVLEDMMIAIAGQIDADGVVEAANFTGAAVGTQGVAANSATLIAARKVLVDAKVPMGSQMYFVAGSQTESDFLGLSLFHQANTSGSASTLESAFLGKKFGFDLYTSQNISRSGGGDKNLAFHPAALTLAMRPLMSPGAELGVQSATGVTSSGLGVRITKSWDAKAQAIAVVLSALYGWKAVQPTLGLYAYGA